MQKLIMNCLVAGVFCPGLAWAELPVICEIKAAYGTGVCYGYCGTVQMQIQGYSNSVSGIAMKVLDSTAAVSIPFAQGIQACDVFPLPAACAAIAKQLRPAADERLAELRALGVCK